VPNKAAKVRHSKSNAELKPENVREEEKRRKTPPNHIAHIFTLLPPRGGRHEVAEASESRDFRLSEFSSNSFI
jgi:hypothetical protein